MQTNIEFDACWDRKETKYVQGVSVYILNVDDLIAMKEYANREQDKIDIISLKKYYFSVLMQIIYRMKTVIWIWL